MYTLVFAWTAIILLNMCSTLSKKNNMNLRIKDEHFTVYLECTVPKII